MIKPFIYFFMQRIIIITIYVCTLFLPKIAYTSPSHSFHKLHLPELSGTAFYKLYQDKSGYVWIASRTGLHRFDGYNLKKISHELGNSAPLSESAIVTIFEDEQNNLWVAGNHGLYRFITSDNTFKKYSHDPNRENSIPKGTIFTHLVDGEGKLWISSSEGLALYDPNKDEFRRVIPFTRELSEAGSMAEQKRLLIMGMEEVSPNKYLLVTYSNGIYVYDHITKKALHSPVYSAGKEITKFRSSFELNSNSFLLSSLMGVFEFNIKDWELKPFFPESIKAGIVNQGYPVVFQRQDDAGVYIADGELHYFDGQSLSTYFRYSDFNIRDLSDRVLVSNVLKTQDNGLLIAVNGVGLFSAHQSLDSVPLVTDANYPKKATQSKPKVIKQDNQARIWASEGDFINIFEETQSESRVNVLASIPLKNVHSLSFTKLGKLYVANASAIYRVNSDFSVDDVFSIIDRNLTPITKIDWISEDELLINLEQGLYRYHVEEDKLVKLTTAEFVDINLDHYSNKEVYLSPSREQIFVSFWRDGYLVYDLKLNQVVLLKKESDHDYPLPKVELTIKGNESNGKLWLLLKENLYALYDWETKKIKVLSAPVAPLTCVAGSEQSHFLEQSSGVLLKIDKGQAMAFDEQNGVMPGMLNGNLCYLSSGNRLYLGSSDGLRVFRQPAENTEKPKIIITQFLISDEPQTLYNNPLVKTVENIMEAVYVPYDRNIFSFKFTSSSIAHPRSNQFRYRLIGVDSDWRYTGSANRNATYTNLDSGAYRFEVEASNNSGLFSERRIVDVFVSSNPLLSWWAITLYCVFIIGCIISWIVFLKITVRRQTKQIANDALILDSKNREQIELTEKIKKLLNIKEGLLRHISHEFKSPLTVLLGYIDEIEHSLSQTINGFGGEKHSEIVVRQIRYIGSLTNQLMDLARLEGAIDLQLRPLDISNILNKIIPMYDGFAKQLNIKIHTSIQPNLIIDADQPSFERIISNLISNAIKYNCSSGTVTISAVESDDQIVIKIQDTGIGISDDDKKIIFKQFGKVENRKSLDHQVESTGLGLAIVKEAVEANLGNITVNSQLEVGSEFIVSFPISKHKGENNDKRTEISILLGNDIVKKSQKSENSEINLDNKRKTILLVEDIDDITYLINDVLNEHYNVIRAKDGKQGLEMACQYLPDVIISDVMMPIMDGYEFAKEVYADDKTAHIPVLFLTALDSEEAQIKGLNLGAVDFIHKPFKPQVLALKIKNIIDKNEALSSRFALASTTACKETRRNVSRDPKFTEKIDAYIEKNLSEKITVEGMANALYMDRSAFTRKVKTISSLNAQQYILHYRLAKAYDLLVSSESVSEVALQLGFSTQNHLSTAFSKQFGITCRERMSGKQTVRADST
ncbi:hybrid sensor histidine kinase/response regulator transcription factor [Aliiglaciecola sp. LCG003]|uniref:hybrid sensor histidine kinase/response regulator transcription factor n=1 Tax=Aliiglaciecola sp. LCG003 TaxID=3053655 RepID=UPI00257469A9|nr:hybrid sensor histidine kinase/response regulator transcription factor [Aliiglaciecola sp. LCG003]WJG11182.1 response regulator [Aliiglaciecola sp. LCG003]